AGALQGAVAPREAHRLDQIERHAEAGGEADDGADIAGLVRLVQSETHQERGVTGRRSIVSVVVRVSRSPFVRSISSRATRIRRSEPPAPVSKRTRIVPVIRRGTRAARAAASSG